VNPYRVSDPEPESSDVAPGLGARLTSVPGREGAAQGAVLKAVAFAAERFLAAGDWRDCIDEVLARLGQEAGADRVVLFANEYEPDGAPAAMVPWAEWAAPGVQRVTGRPEMNGHLYEDGHERWIRLLGSGEFLLENTSRPTAGECTCMARSGVRSAVLVPVMSGGEWWGFVAFHDCTEGRDWDSGVVDALRTAAVLVGAAIERGRTEARLREAEDKFRTLVEHVPAVIYVDRADSIATSLYLSPQIDQLVGTTRDQHLNDPELWLKMIDPIDRERWLTESRRVMEGGEEEFALEYRIRAVDGRQVWVRDRAVLVRDEDGRPHNWRGVILDITEQKRVEQALAESEERYRRLIEASPDAVVVYSDYRIVFANEAAARLVGASGANELLGQAILNTVHPDYREIVQARANAGLEQGISAPPEEVKFVRLDGTVIDVEITAIAITFQGRPAVLGVARNVTERRRTENALRDAEAKFRTLVEQLPAIVYMAEFEQAGDWLYVSPRIRDILGYSAEEWAADPTLFDQRIHPEDEPVYREAEARSSETGQPLMVEYRMLARDGSAVWFQDQAVVVRDADGRPLFHQGIMYDVTSSKQAEDVLVRGLQREQEASDRLRALEDLRNRFLTAVAGELRTPLTAVLGYALTLARPDMELAAADRADIASRLAASARRLEALMEDLLDVDRMARGVLEPALAPINVGDLCRQVAAEADLGDREVSVDAGATVLRVDGAKVERILESLLANVARHTPVGTHVWVRLESVPEGVILCVDDDGPGVPDDVKKTIFQPFLQGAGPAPSSGTGIGLALVSGFADLHGGRAWVEDRPGGGAAFRVLLPEPRRAQVP
jgi:PAS domain S-box-containing protein